MHMMTIHTIKMKMYSTINLSCVLERVKIKIIQQCHTENVVVDLNVSMAVNTSC